MPRKRMIGNELMLFDDGTGTAAPNLVISSHGLFLPHPGRPGADRSGWLTVPGGVRLFFYSPDRRILVDPTIDALLKHTPAEIKVGGELVRNYRLMKYQGRHGSKDETYASILGGIEMNRTQADNQETMLRKLGLDLDVAMEPDQRRAAYEALKSTLPPDDAYKLGLAFGERRIERYDVLTVRNRNIDIRSVLHLGVTLKEVLAAVPGVYEKIHCAFCRVSVLTPFDKGYDAVPGTDWDRRATGFRRPPS